MRTFFVLALTFTAVILAVQNAGVVTVTIFVWHIQASLAIVIGACVALGAVAGALVALPRLYSMRVRERRFRAQLADLDTRTEVDTHAGAATRPSQSH